MANGAEMARAAVGGWRRWGGPAFSNMHVTVLLIAIGVFAVQMALTVALHSTDSREVSVLGVLLQALALLFPVTVVVCLLMIRGLDSRRGDLETKLTLEQQRTQQFADTSRRHQEALRRSEARNQALLEAIPDLLLRIGRDGRVAEVKRRIAAPTRSRPTDTIMGRYVTSGGPQRLGQLVPLRLARRFMTAADRALKTQQTEVFEYALRRRQGAPRFFEARIVPLQEQDEVLALLREITERKRADLELRRAKAQAERADLAKTQFLANLSHEIRTPMTAIAGYTQMLVGQTPDDGTERADWARQITRNAEYLLSLVNDVLDLSRIEAGGVKVRPHPCSPVEMVEDAAAMMRPRALERGLELTMSYQGELPRTVATDPLRLRQVLVNLMSNAIKFTDRGTVGIEVRMESADGGLPARLVIAVTDTGIGIPPHRLASLFQPFMRAHAEEQPHRSGTGLGLSIAQRLILLLGGQIAVASRPGEGSTFTVSLPLTAGEAGDAATGEVLLADLQRGRGDAPGPVTLHGLRTLLVDDNPHNERIIRYILQRAGALVSSVTDGLAGVEAVLGAQADGRPFDVILMDMRMPRMDGYTAVRLLRGEEVRTPIIALTAQAVGEDDRRCLASGCDAYVAKPIDEAALLQTVSRLARCEAVADGPSAPSMTGGRGTNLAHDAGFAAAAMRYAAGLNDSAEQLRSAWMVRDHRVLLEVTHRLRGTATNYGFPEITRAAGECEILLRAPADEPILRTAIDRLIDALQKAAPPVRMSS